VRIRSEWTLLPILALLALPLSAQSVDPPDPVDLTDAMTLASAWLDAEQDFKNIPALTAAVVRDQDVVWSGAFGHVDVEAGIEAAPDTRFHIASISKTFAAVAVMTLVDAGQLRLDDHVSDVVPWFHPPALDGDQAPITIRNLLTHSSGLNRELIAPIWSDVSTTPSGLEMQAELTAPSPLYPSRTLFQYSNLAFLLIGEIVAEVSGMPYVDYLEQAVLDPLGLEATTASYPESLYGTRHAIRYGTMTRNQEYPRLGYTKSENMASMGGLSSNVLDLARYASWQLRLHEKNATTEVLRPSTLRDMHRVHFTDRDWEVTWGLGFNIAKGPADQALVSHGGSFPGHKSQLLIDPKSRMAYVVMASTSSANPGAYAQAVMKLVNKAKAVPDDAENRLSRARLAEYTGRFEFVDGMGEARISPWEGRLALLELPTADPAGAMQIYEHVEGDTFRRVRPDGDYGETLSYERDGSGRVTGASYFSYEMVRVGS
jgi:CubicO group peptidase (beta-lactamase class C family)